MSEPRRLRTYALTQGRTHVDSTLPLDAMVAAGLLAPSGGLSPEQARIVELCAASPQSLADLSASLDLPLQVIRVLLVDLINAGTLRTSSGNEGSVAAHQDLALLEEVLDGIESL